MTSNFASYSPTQSQRADNIRSLLIALGLTIFGYVPKLLEIMGLQLSCKTICIIFGTVYLIAFAIAGGRSSRPFYYGGCTALAATLIGFWFEVIFLALPVDAPWALMLVLTFSANFLIGAIAGAVGGLIIRPRISKGDALAEDVE